MNEQFNDIRKKMEAKGYEYIQEIEAYCEDYTSSNGRIFGERGGFTVFGKELGNITILRVCGTKYEYEITKANRVVYVNSDIFLFTSPKRMVDEDGYRSTYCNAQFISNNGTTWYFCNPYWN